MSSPLDGNGVAAWPPRDWQCPKCSYRSYCTFDADKGGPGNDLRCLNCKAVFRAPPAPSQTAVEPVALAQALKNLTEGAEQEDREILYAAASTLTAQAAALVAAERQSEALMAKLQPLLAAHGTCGCSYDTPDDLCMHHSPQLVAATARAEAAEERIAELEAGLAFYASKANYADVPLQQWFRENEGKDAPTGYRCGNIDISAKPGHAIAPIFADLGDLARRLTHQEKNNGR